MPVIIESGLAIAIALASILSVASDGAIQVPAPDAAEKSIVGAAAPDDGWSLGLIIPCGTHLMSTYYWQPLRGPLLICRFDAWDERQPRAEHE